MPKAFQFRLSQHVFYIAANDVRPAQIHDRSWSADGQPQYRIGPAAAHPVLEQDLRALRHEADHEAAFRRRSRCP